MTTLVRISGVGMIAFLIAVVCVGTPILGANTIYYGVIFGTFFGATSVTSITQLKAFHLPPQFRGPNATQVSVSPSSDRRSNKVSSRVYPLSVSSGSRNDSTVVRQLKLK